MGSMKCLPSKLWTKNCLKGSYFCIFGKKGNFWAYFCIYFLAYHPVEQRYNNQTFRQSFQSQSKASHLESLKLQLFCLHPDTAKILHFWPFWGVFSGAIYTPKMSFLEKIKIFKNLRRGPNFQDPKSNLEKNQNCDHEKFVNKMKKRQKFSTFGPPGRRSRDQQKNSPTLLQSHYQGLTACKI